MPLRHIKALQILYSTLSFDYSLCRFDSFRCIQTVESFYLSCRIVRIEYAKSNFSIFLLKWPISEVNLSYSSSSSVQKQAHFIYFHSFCCLIKIFLLFWSFISPSQKILSSINFKTSYSCLNLSSFFSIYNKAKEWYEERNSILSHLIHLTDTQLTRKKSLNYFLWSFLFQFAMLQFPFFYHEFSYLESCLEIIQNDTLILWRLKF